MFCEIPLARTARQHGSLPFAENPLTVSRRLIKRFLLTIDAFPFSGLIPTIVIIVSGLEINRWSLSKIALPNAITNPPVYNIFYPATALVPRTKTKWNLRDVPERTLTNARFNDSLEKREKLRNARKNSFHYRSLFSTLGRAATINVADKSARKRARKREEHEREGERFRWKLLKRITTYFVRYWHRRPLSFRYSSLKKKRKSLEMKA